MKQNKTQKKGQAYQANSRKQMMQLYKKVIKWLGLILLATIIILVVVFIIIL